MTNEQNGDFYLQIDSVTIEQSWNHARHVGRSQMDEGPLAHPGGRLRKTQILFKNKSDNGAADPGICQNSQSVLVPEGSG